MTSHRFTRRQFTLAMAAGLACPTTGLSLPLRRRSANDRIQLGFIGVGTMGRGHLRSFLGYEDAQVVAVSDVVQERRDSALAMIHERYAGQRQSGEFHGAESYVDFREMLQRDDVDAVVIATPDHLHAIPAVLAAEAGKDIYCEKPLTHNIVEGRRLVQAVKGNEVIFQTGSQQRSEFGGRFRTAVELIRNGRIGDVHTVRIGVGEPAVPCDLPEEEIPEGTDWDRWLGPAAHRAYNQILCPRGVHDHFPAWRRYQEFAGGGLADMGAHHFDIAQWALHTDHTGPIAIEPPADGARSGLKFTYASGVEMFHGGRSGCTFEGSAGTIYVDRGTLESDPAEILSEPLDDAATRVDHSTDHRRNWIECIRSREAPICDSEIGHRSATICHLGNIGYRLGRSLRWDPEREQFPDDDEAAVLLWREPRPEWDLI